MNSEIPQIPESEPIKAQANLELPDANDNLNNTEAEAELVSESSEPLTDMWEDNQKDTIVAEVADEIANEEEEPVFSKKIAQNVELPEVAAELINDKNLSQESDKGLEVTLQSSKDEPVEPELNELQSFSQELSEPDSTTEEIAPTQEKTELFTDTWLDESDYISKSSAQSSATVGQTGDLASEITTLEQKKATLIEEIRLLEAKKEEAISQQVRDLQRTLGQMLEEGMAELRERKSNILIDIEKLERRRERIRQEMRTNFAGASQDLALRVQGFKEYLVGSLQDLVTAAEQLELSQRPASPPSREVRDSRDYRDSRGSRDTRDTRDPRDPRARSQSPRRSSRSSQPQFTEQTFADQERKIRQILEQYRTNPDYYGAPWQLRRTFEPIHEERVKDWFFVKGGRGAIKGVGSRLQNILVTAAIISVLYRLYRDRCRVLVLVDTPEKLGEWRRGLQDCLGISRGDFGSSRGVVLFESADVLVQRAERLLQDKLLPLVIIDETEELVNLSLLKFPLWLAFTGEPQSKTTGYLY